MCVRVSVYDIILGWFNSDNTFACDESPHNTEQRLCACGADYNSYFWCDPCPAGTYSGSKAEKCTSCNAGTYSESSGASYCLACAAGKHSAAHASTCLGSLCKAGEYAKAPTRTVLTSCCRVTSTRSLTCSPPPCNATATRAVTLGLFPTCWS